MEIIEHSEFDTGGQQSDSRGSPSPIAQAAPLNALNKSEHWMVRKILNHQASGVEQ